MTDRKQLIVVSVLTCLFALTPALSIAAAWAAAPPIVYVAIIVVRTALLVGVGALLRPWPLKIAAIGAAILFAAFDVLATTSLWSVYDPPWQAEPEFIYFQF